MVSTRSSATKGGRVHLNIRLLLIVASLAGIAPQSNETRPAHKKKGRGGTAKKGEVAKKKAPKQQVCIDISSRASS